MIVLLVYLFIAVLCTLPVLPRSGRVHRALGVIGTVLSLGTIVPGLFLTLAVRRWNRVDYHALPTDVDGRRVLHLRTIPETRGVSVRLVRKGSRGESPFAGAAGSCPPELRGKGAVRFDGIETAWSAGGDFCDRYPSPCCLVDRRRAHGEAGEIEITYEVDSETRVALDAVEVQIRKPSDPASWEGTMFARLLAVVSFVLGPLLALYGLAALLAQRQKGHGDASPTRASQYSPR